MRISIASLLGLGCAAALLAPATTATATPAAAPASRASTVTLPLAPLPAGRAGGAAARGLRARGTAGYSLLGVSWDDPAAALDGTVEVRTHPAAGGGRSRAWTGWRALTADSEDRPDLDSADLRGPHARGATAPLWVGPSDGVEVRVTGGGALPDGLRVDLVDPGTGAAADTSPADTSPAGTSPADAPSADAPTGEALAPGAPAAQEAAPRLLPMAPHQAPRPGIVTRAGWGADESLRAPGFVYTGDVKVVFVHHTDTGNEYSCSDSPKVIRSIYQYHVRTNGWRDIGYNFLVDRCGTIYEGRAGGVSRAVLGAHTLGFNTDSSGVAALGSYDSAAPPQAQVDGIAKIAAWKLGLTGRDAGGSATLTSASDGSRYAEGTAHTFEAISGHRDAFNTDCPGDTLYDRLGDIRSWAVHLQGR
ncbi:N-acetylmuramoyl-L-alanine amidase [Kitasatospora sp. NBC_01287]|uniref:peptidoglycan recognition protein family protein n=1 Tax=Kitasatospora sp. NBC_01287 TaxID=2903573 RepID=UPI00224CBE62|nr:N-acetylmuramoyl-L-alanine amidase [Kitasatospora sp. NBC_01287]MCX4748680.1 N-acetylmuramoyl-L-alanine amidase [Kitasatospora sp. NBC_01287]